MRMLLLVLAIFCTMTSTTCRKWDCSQTEYSFEGHYKAYPDQDSIRIGDTIWLEATVPVRQTNLLTGQVVNYSEAVNLGTSIQFLELITGSNDPAPRPAANDFNHLLKVGTVSSLEYPNKIRSYLFEEESGMYLFKVGIVPKKKGLFSFATSSAANVYTRSEECAKAGFELTFLDTDQHIYLYEQNRPGYTPSSYERTHMYVFKVY